MIFIGIKKVGDSGLLCWQSSTTSITRVGVMVGGFTTKNYTTTYHIQIAKNADA